MKPDLAAIAHLEHRAAVLFYAQALLAHWQRLGARVINGADLLAVDSSKARQLSIISGLGLATPETRVVHRARDLIAASQGMAFPLLVKVNIGGSGAGITRYRSRDELAQSIEDGSVPDSIDKVLLLQDYVPPRGGTITRIETLGGRYLYAIGMEKVDPSTDLVLAAERIAEAVGMAVGGVEVVIDDRDGVPRFYDINGLSNFVANPLDVLGWDPHERLVDYLAAAIAETRRP